LWIGSLSKRKRLKRIIKWILGVGLGLVVVLYLLFKYAIDSRYNIISQVLERDIQESKKDSWCIQNANLLVNKDDPAFNIASPRKLYLELFLLRNESKSRKYSSLVYTRISRHYLEIEKSKIGFTSMGAWHLNGMALILAIEEKISKEDLALLYCHLRSTWQIENKYWINIIGLAV
jgi:hypothetical protein